MLLGCALDQRVQEKVSRSKIDHWRASDAYWINVSAKQLGQWHRRAEVALPHHRARGGVERINIVRFGHSNDHCPVRAAFDVQWLSINVAYDRAVEAKVPRQISSSGRRKCRIDVNAVARRIVVLLRHVDLRICRKNRAPQAGNEK